MAHDGPHPIEPMWLTTVAIYALSDEDLLARINPLVATLIFILLSIICLPFVPHPSHVSNCMLAPETWPYVDQVMTSDDGLCDGEI